MARQGWTMAAAAAVSILLPFEGYTMFVSFILIGNTQNCDSNNFYERMGKKG